MFRYVVGTFALGAGGALTTTLFKPEHISASASKNHGPSSWNYNWDFRAPSSCVEKPEVPVDASQKTRELETTKPTAVRHILLVRHGQYLSSMKEDADRKLTELGREQAKLTGERLKRLGIIFDRIINSTMTRATETADIICTQISAPRKECDLIREGAPFPPEPPVFFYQPDDNKRFYRDGPSIEAAFHKYFHRADPSQKKDSYELLVCHANVIRYFVCRVLQLPPEAWARFDVNHGSITWVSIGPNGCVVVKYVGDTGYMPPEKISTYGASGPSRVRCQVP